MVERVDRSKCELNVALRIDIIQRLKRDVGDVLHVDVFVDHDDALSEHRLTERPDSVHYFASLSRIGLANRNDHQVMEHAFDWEIDVDELRNGQLHQRQKNAFDSFAHPSVFLRRLADHRGRVDRVFSVRDAGDMKYGVFVFERVEASVIAEGSFGAKFVEIDIAFENDLGVSWNLQIDSLAFHQFDRLLAQKSRDDEFFHVGWSWHDRRKSERRVCADSNRNFHFARGPIAGGQRRTP